MFSHPLVIDLDGTLICTDMLHESALRVLRDRPFDVLLIPYWLAQSKAVLKRQLAERTRIDPASLPYNHDLLGWLKQQRAQGRKLILCTATDRFLAEAIAQHLGIFEEVIASDGICNLSGSHKAQTLEQRFGHAGFDYAGNSTADLAVWRCARRAIVVNASTELARQAGVHCEVERVFSSSPPGFAAWPQVLRIHQWLKNLLLFVPLVAAHQIANADSWLTLVLAFASFSLCASSVYIANDLLDLESDRKHSRKYSRPFASGRVPVVTGVVLMPVLLTASLVIAWQVGSNFFSWLMFYFVLTCAYSWGLKRLVLVTA